MNADMRELGSGQQFRKCRPDVSIIQRRTDGAGEYENRSALEGLLSPRYATG
jgi:hypothetical protein